MTNIRCNLTGDFGTQASSPLSLFPVFAIGESFFLHVDTMVYMLFKAINPFYYDLRSSAVAGKIIPLLFKLSIVNPTGCEYDHYC